VQFFGSDAMTRKEFERVLAIFCFCFGGLALLQGHRWIAAWLFASSLLCLYCALRARAWVITREAKAILGALLGSALFIGSDIALHIVTPLTVFCVGSVWGGAAAWLGRRNGPMYVPLRELRKAVMRLPKLQGLALTMSRIGNVLCVVGVCMWLYELVM
jgi:hypothetical protein